MKFFKNTRIAPSAEAVIDAVPISVGFWQPSPSRTFFSPPDQSREKASTGFRISDVDVWECFEKREHALPSHRRLCSSTVCVLSALITDSIMTRFFSRTSSETGTSICFGETQSGASSLRWDVNFVDARGFQWVYRTHQRTPLGGKVECFHYTKRVLFMQKITLYLSNSRYQ